jgi:nicotinamidase-related amidase
MLPGSHRTRRRSPAERPVSVSKVHLQESIGVKAVHICVDMQRLLAPEGPWPTPWMASALECQLRLIEKAPQRSVFTRFIPPRSAGDMPGKWRHYYDKWRVVTRDFLDPALLELVEPLPRFVPPAVVVDKTRYSGFWGSNLQATLSRLEADTLVVSGAETDVCVLSTIMSAIDIGYRVIVAADAVCSSSDRCHDALMTLYHQRFSEQIEIADTETLLRSWVTI